MKSLTLCNSSILFRFSIRVEIPLSRSTSSPKKVRTESISLVSLVPDICTFLGRFRAAVPSGASTGAHDKLHTSEYELGRHVLVLLVIPREPHLRH